MMESAIAFTIEVEPRGRSPSPKRLYTARPGDALGSEETPMQFVLKTCPRCHGDLMRSLDGEFSCIQCGYELKPEERMRMFMRPRQNGWQLLPRAQHETSPAPKTNGEPFLGDCKTCGKAMYGSYRRQYCSAECRQSAQRKAPKSPVKRMCAHCQVKPAQRARLYCTNRCKAYAESRRRAERALAS